MSVQMIGTWLFSKKAFEKVKDEFTEQPVKAMINAIKTIENDPTVHTVGSYSYPNEEGFLELDSAFMNGDTLHVGSVIGSRTIVNPIEVAYSLSKQRNNIILTNFGADKYAQQNGFSTSEKLEIYVDNSSFTHDTMGVICLDKNSLYTAISSSGRKNKHLGRVGDSPLIGSGFYCDSNYGAAVATGNGEDILRGCLCKEIVDALSFGLSITEAVETVGNRHLERMLNEYGETFFMILGLDKNGQMAAFTSGDLFPFATIEDNEVKLYFAIRENGHTVIHSENEELLKSYTGD